MGNFSIMRLTASAYLPALINWTDIPLVIDVGRAGTPSNPPPLGSWQAFRFAMLDLFFSLFYEGVGALDFFWTGIFLRSFDIISAIAP
jgi:hypothetical protein